MKGSGEYADQNHVEIEALPKDPEAHVPPELALSVLRNFLAEIFPGWCPSVRDQANCC
jgi:hypothetical protein